MSNTPKDNSLLPIPKSMANELEVVAEFSNHLHRRENYNEKLEGGLPIDDDIEALLFLLKQTFYGARSAELSEEYYQHAESVIREKEPLVRKVLNGTAEGSWGSDIEDRLGDSINNSADCEMVISAIKWIRDQNRDTQNIAKMTLDAVEQNRVQTHHEKLREIHNVGPKKASLYLRSFVTVGQLEDALSDADMRYVVPIDRQVVGLTNQLLSAEINSDDWEAAAERIIRECREHSVSPIRYDEGAWYVGAYAEEILVDSISDINPASHTPVKQANE